MSLGPAFPPAPGCLLLAISISLPSSALRFFAQRDFHSHPPRAPSRGTQAVRRECRSACFGTKARAAFEPLGSRRRSGSARPSCPRAQKIYNPCAPPPHMSKCAKSRSSQICRLRASIFRASTSRKSTPFLVRSPFQRGFISS